MRELGVSVIRHDYLSIYVNSFVIQTANHTVCVDSGLFGYKERLKPYLCEGKKILLLSTHGHWDHIGLQEYIRSLGGRIYAQFGDNRFYGDFKWHWNVLFGQYENDFNLPKERRQVFEKQIGSLTAIDIEIENGQTIVIDDLSFQVLHTPGHSNGSVCFLEKNSQTLFTGDTLMGNGFFGGMPQYCNKQAYLNSMERLGRLKVFTVYSSHTSPLAGESLTEMIRCGIASVNRIDAAVKEFVYTNRKAGTIKLGEAVSYVCKAESKAVSAGAFVTVLAHLRSIRGKYPAVDACVRQYIHN